MSSAFFKPFYSLIISIIILVIFISIFFTPTILSAQIEEEYIESSLMEISENGFAWPIPGYTKITSYFGKRQSPTQGASTYHKGIDIGAPEGTKLIATIDGKVTFLGFLGGGGYTLTLSYENMKITYCHISPDYLVELGQEVSQGQIIAKVGPKYVYGVVRK